MSIQILQDVRISYNNSSADIDGTIKSRRQDQVRIDDRCAYYRPGNGKEEYEKLLRKWKKVDRAWNCLYYTFEWEYRQARDAYDAEDKELYLKLTDGGYFLSVRLVIKYLWKHLNKMERLQRELTGPKYF